MAFDQPRRQRFVPRGGIEQAPAFEQGGRLSGARAAVTYLVEVALQAFAQRFDDSALLEPTLVLRSRNRGTAGLAARRLAILEKGDRQALAGGRGERFVEVDVAGNEQRLVNQLVQYDAGQLDLIDRQRCRRQRVVDPTSGGVARGCDDVVVAPLAPQFLR